MRALRRDENIWKMFCFLPLFSAFHALLVPLRHQLAFLFSDQFDESWYKILKRELTQWVWCGGCWPGKFFTCMARMGNHAWSLLLQRPWTDWKGTEATAKKAMTKKTFQGESTAPVHCYSTWDHRLVLRYTGALCAYLAKTGVLRLQRPMLRPLNE